EKSTDIQIFNPRSMADRILGMGDTINLVRKAEEHIDKEEAKELEEKFKTASFTYNDYLKQMQSFKKMGSLSSLMGMMPGMGALGNMKMDDKELGRIEAMIQSMTFAERNGLCELTVPRRRRVATGSGVKLEQVHRLVKSFEKLKDMAKQMSNPKKLEKMLGGMKLWR
ncbi:MAG: signal recognition particle protein, partial [Chlamydiia bacterium]|nr:signal recognition particle protein [Chlamydiia bacterium]